METAPASENVAVISRYALRGGGFDDRDAYLAAPSDEMAAVPSEAMIVKDGTVGGTWPELTAEPGTSIATVSGAVTS